MNKNKIFLYEADYLDQEVVRSTLKFHYAGKLFLQPDVLKNTLLSNLSKAALVFIERNFNLKLGNQNHNLSIKLNKEAVCKNRRSNRTFNNKIEFNILKEIIINSFGKQENGSRVIPSAGGLYPIESIIWIKNNTFDEINKDSFYHFNVDDCSLDYMTSGNIMNATEHGLELKNKPNIAVIYFININKALIKYRFRGYRNALIEVGLMSNNLDVNCINSGLGTLCWSSFDDNKLSNLLHLNPNKLLPVLVQWVG